MKQLIPIIFLIFLMNSCVQSTENISLEDIINKSLQTCQEKSLILADTYKNKQNILPRAFDKGKIITVGSADWTSGFFPGVLWYCYENSKSNEVLSYAKEYTSRLEKEQFTTDNHDVGFILNCSYGNGYRLTNDSNYLKVLINGAKSLSTRYNAKVGLIRSWDFHKDLWQYPVIIDNMMNLELLLVAASESGDINFKDIAISHALKTLKNHYRDDFSCYHVVSYDTISAVPEKKQTFQGYSDESSWARGQSWGLYGFTLMYRETKDSVFLQQAKKIVTYLISHPKMPKDYIPYWDYDDKAIPNVPRDASAAAVMASALIELSDYVDKEQADFYLKIAEKQIRELSSQKYMTQSGESGGFILKHSVGFLPQNSEVDVSLNYADYYYVEALIRMKNVLNRDENDQRIQ